MRSSSATFNASTSLSTSASRKPSVATILMRLPLATKRTALSVKRLSSFETAKSIRRGIAASVSEGRVTFVFVTSGNFGKVSLTMPASLKDDRPHATCTQWFSSALKRISASGSERRISSKRRAGTVTDPGVVMAATACERNPMARLVALSASFSFCASISTFESTATLAFLSMAP